jgi:hypothetical protein
VKLNSYHDKLTVGELREVVGVSQSEFGVALGADKRYAFDHFCDAIDRQTLGEQRFIDLQQIAKALGIKVSIKFELPSGHFVALGENLTGLGEDTQ